MKVFVGLSGGVDSSVSAALLQERGFEVVGVFIKTWQPDFVPCTWKEERRDAMRVAAHLGIPFITLDLEKEYKELVAEYFIEEYRQGRTPNPDVMCNKEIKFGAFFKKAIKAGADFVATGHYAQSVDGRLFEGKDCGKDQSYFLWTLSQDQLKKTLFPVGDMEKSEVRVMAEKFGLPTASKKDSQGICFLGEVNMKEFLGNYIEKKAGDVLNTNGEVIGRHDGAVFYTLGERRGLTISKKGADDEALYVVAKDLEKNSITVAPRSKYDVGVGEVGELELRNVHWIKGSLRPGKYEARIRYRQEKQGCVVTQAEIGVKVVFDEPQQGVSSGQSCVLYVGDECVGGGDIV